MIGKYAVMTVCLVAFFMPAAFAAQQPMLLSLKQCIDLALKNNIDVLVSRAQEKQAQRFPLARDDAERGVEPAAGVADFRRRRHF